MLTAALGDGAVPAAKANLEELQARVTGTCAPGSFVRAVNADGSVVCQAEVRPLAVYTRWGWTTCPNTASLAYQGIAGGARYDHTGSGADLLCLTLSPTWGSFLATRQDGARLYGAEYQTNGYGVGLDSLQDSDVPCAVCEAEARAVIMHPGSRACPAGWTVEYAGYLMASRYADNRGMWACVDEAAEAAGDSSLNIGALLYPTEAECGALPCLPYVQDREVTCAVCSR